ncbi:MAG: hypothetical protein ACP5D4_16920 [Baaleninema sp.]
MQFEIEWKMTEKVLQIKALGRERGQFPPRIAGIETSIYEGYQWIYQVKSNGTAFIKLKPVPSAIANVKENSILAYTIPSPTL